MNLKEKLKGISSEAKSDWLEKAGDQLARSRSRKNARKVALRVLEILHEQELSQTELATRMGVTRQRVADIVKGKENFTFETIDKLERAFGVVLMTIPPAVSESVREFKDNQGIVSIPANTFTSPMGYTAGNIWYGGGGPMEILTLDQRVSGLLSQTPNMMDPLFRAAISMGKVKYSTFQFTFDEVGYCAPIIEYTKYMYKKSDSELAEFTS